ncbi:mannose-1-phosphate guanylyltransferase [Pedobacter frigiditerrae]|uniref:mannose-1-phosphate guanylyltransferase n=1 Tax=Pedobacter frigiditerrae TaxID=2530452 RepID=A0A4R0N371_9SPHI|nr:mannose-1-phosphate guanylyltransferase [Pedobacter frigiditerrae]TCC94220.1 mannose-1-phosphate guanylyltransferase [Pedobacter frigiditerrae]
MNPNNYVLIMAGGVGSRFWPKSRNNFPKQFLDILGIGKSLLQLTYERFLKLCPKENIFIVTNNQYEDIILQQLEGITSSQLICEPSRNNTAPCIAYASFKLQALNPEANIVVAPSDHFILYEDVFIEKIKIALAYTEQNEALVTLGINPIRPDTGYGYIKYASENVEGVYKVAQFTEKPTLDKAKIFLEDGNYVWNAGIFIWKVGSIINALQKHAAEIHDLFNKGIANYNTELERGFIDTHYPNSPNISIDYAIMEQADNVYTIPAEFGWSDLGTWASLYDAAPKNEEHNVIAAQQINVKDTNNSIIHINGDKLAVIRGLENFIVVDEGNALLIYPKAQEQEIKEVVKEMSISFGDRFN